VTYESAEYADFGHGFFDREIFALILLPPLLKLLDQVSQSDHLNGTMRAGLSLHRLPNLAEGALRKNEMQEAYPRPAYCSCDSN